MNKKDYALIAKALKSGYDQDAFCLDTYEDKRNFTHYITRALKKDNPKGFDEIFFMKHAGLLSQMKCYCTEDDSLSIPHYHD